MLIAMDTDLRIDVLGPLQVRTAEPIDISRPSHRRLIAILAINGARSISTDALIDRYWPGGPPATAKAAIQTHISAVRALIGTDSIEFDGTGYRLRPIGVDLDAEEFDDLWTQAYDATDRGAWLETLECSQRALRLWRGEPYEDIRDDWFAQPDVARLTEMRLVLAELECEAMLNLGRPADAAPRLEYLVLENPEREKLWALLMKSRYRLGRHAEAVQAFRAATEHLAEMGLEPSDRLRRLEEQILLHDRSLTPTPHNLQADLDSFIGRAEEVRTIRALVSDNRLVTAVGPGGAGKTRLAAHAAKGLFGRFPGGVWQVTLESIGASELVPAAICGAMGLKPRDASAQEALVEALSSGPTLILLDNCEHLLPTLVTFIEHLLIDVPSVALLATSREALRIPSEVIVDVGGLPVADSADSEAVALFLERAEARSRLVVDHDTITTVAQLCHQMDGLPLAIELAASRVSSLGLQPVADHLDQQLALLSEGSATAPQRHQTLRATIDWSYQLLSEAQQAALRELSVFRNGFSLDAAEAVMGGNDPTTSALKDLASLADKSLISAAIENGVQRYRMLETVRQFAHEQLETDPAIEDVRERHARWASQLVRDIWPAMYDSRISEVASALATEASNLQAANLWASTHDKSTSAQILLGLACHWYLSGQFTRALEDVEDALSSETRQARRSILLSLAARIEAYAENLDAAMANAEAAARDIDQLSTPPEQAWVLATQQLSYFMSARRDPTLMLPVAKRALNVAQQLGEAPAAVLAFETAADGYCWNGQTAEGLSLQEEALRIARNSASSDLVDHAYGHAIYNLMLDPVSRSRRPASHVEEWTALTGASSSGSNLNSNDWLPWIYMQQGDLDGANRELEAIGGRKREGYNRTIYQLVSATVAWMRGDATQASTAIAELGDRAISERWWHVYYPLAAEIATERGDIAAARRTADSYRRRDVHPAGQTAKLGVLMPLVRAEINMALIDGARGESPGPSEILQEMRQLMIAHPPPTQASTSLLTPSQNIAFAEAELTRLTGPEPDLWLIARHSADYAYYRTYALMRMAEATLALGQQAEATELLQTAFAEATHMRFAAIARSISRTAQRAGVRLE